MRSIQVMASGEVDRRVAWLASKAALVTLNYDLPSGDPDTTIPAKRLTDWVVRKASPGGIVVLHMNHKRFATAAALPAMAIMLWLLWRFPPESQRMKDQLR